MKCEIYCRPCELKADFLRGSYPGEFVRVDRGLSLGRCLCDFCGKQIETSEPVSAVTMGIGDWSPSKSDWVIAYIRPEPKAGSSVVP